MNTTHILTEVKKFLDLGIFQLGLSNFWIGTWFPIDVFQFTVGLIQHQNFQEKRNPFDVRFTHKTAIFW